MVTVEHNCIAKYTFISSFQTCTTEGRLFVFAGSVVAIHPLTSNGLAVVLSQVFAKFITRNSGI